MVRVRERPARAASLAALLVLGAARVASGDGALDAPAAHDSATRQDTDEAVIVLVGEAGEDSELAEVVAELLMRQDVRPRIEKRPQFSPGELTAGGEDERAVWVFVVRESPAVARLYFRGPHAKRFLLRDLTVSAATDEVSHELVGQVVQSSVVALLRSSAGITRDEVRAELTRMHRVRVDDALRPDPSSSSPSAWRGWVALRYGAQWAGADLGLAHGPGAELGLAWRRRAVRSPEIMTSDASPGVVLRARLVAERWFPQTITASELVATVQTFPLRGLLDLGWRTGGMHMLLVGLGAGVDVTTATPEAARSTSVALAAPRTHAVPVLRTELAYAVGGGPFRLVTTLYADVSAFATHYDLELVDGSQRLATLWPVRPGASLSIAWCPALGPE